MKLLLIGLLSLSGCASGGWHWDAQEKYEESERRLIQTRHEIMQNMTLEERKEFAAQQMEFDEAEYNHLTRGNTNPIQGFQQGYNSTQPASVNFKVYHPYGY